MFEIILKALIQLLDSIIGLFQLGHWLEKRSAENSRMGESKLDREARSWQEKIIRSWYFISLLLFLFLGGTGALIWHFMTSR
jgi:hypothetical protein